MILLLPSSLLPSCFVLVLASSCFRFYFLLLTSLLLLSLLAAPFFFFHSSFISFFHLSFLITGMESFLDFAVNPHRSVHFADPAGVYVFGPHGIHSAEPKKKKEKLKHIFLEFKEKSLLFLLLSLSLPAVGEKVFSGQSTQ